MDNAEKELIFSLSKAYHLYNYLLALIVAVSQESRRQLEILSQRAQREGKPAPLMKFANNRFALQLEENRQLMEFVETQKQVWENDVEFVRKLYGQMEQTQIYQDYMASDEDSYDADRELWRKLYKTLIQDNDDLDAILEEKSLYWNDDKDIVDTFVIKTIKRFDPKNGKNQELLPEYKDIEDKDFARKLFRATILNADQYQRFMSEASRNWDFSRLAYMDVVIMQIALAEMMTFPNIPVSVTINEFVELAKMYSTPRSASYINGMLDAIARHLIHTGRLMKSMDEPRSKRGPMGNNAEENAQDDEENSAEE
jgi:N utilization substance protein B